MKTEEEIRAELEKAEQDIKQYKKKRYRPYKALATMQAETLRWVLEEPLLS